MIKNFFKGFFAHIILITVCILSLLPFLWLLSTALKGASENIFQYPPVFLPKEPTLANFKEVLFSQKRNSCRHPFDKTDSSDAEGQTSTWYNNIFYSEIDALINKAQ